MHQAMLHILVHFIRYEFNPMQSNTATPHVHPVMLPYLRPSCHRDLHVFGQTRMSNVNLDLTGFTSDFEDQPNDDCVIPNTRWSREWIGPGDWYPTRHGYPVCSEDSVADGPYRYVAKKRHTLIIDGEKVKGRYWTKYHHLDSTRGSMGWNLPQPFEAGYIYHRELRVHWCWDALIWFRHGCEPWTLELKLKQELKKKSKVQANTDADHAVDDSSHGGMCDSTMMPRRKRFRAHWV